MINYHLDERFIKAINRYLIWNLYKDYRDLM